MKKITSGIIYFGIGISFSVITIVFHIIVFTHTKSLLLRGSAIIFSFSLLLLFLLLIYQLRKKLLTISQSLISCIDNIINGYENIQFDLESETLTSKFNHKLKRLYEILNNNQKQVIEEKQTIQEMISDISHQVKTPMANLKMYNSTLINNQLPAIKQQEFLELMETQIDKLDFLMQAMVKMSRLETGIITLSIYPAPLYDTIGLALAGIVLPSEKKKIEVIVDCPTHLIVPHDKRWTVEALFNILDNAVKYTSPGGKINVTARRCEMTTKIEISDTGKGIPEQHFAQIFKRFYREDDVHNIEGVGIGLYLCREIITKQGGYVQVKSELGKGSTFSVYFSNEMQF